MITRRRYREAAGAQGLGEVRRLHRAVRTDWVVRLWEQKAWWPLPLLVVCGLVAVLGWRAAAVLLLAAASAFLATVYLAPVTDPDGRLWLAVCEEGLVAARRQEVTAIVRWKDVAYTLHWPALVRVEYREPLQFHEIRHAERYEIVGADPSGQEVQVLVDGVLRQRRLVRAVERNVTPVVLERARRDLATTGRAGFGPVTLSATGDLTVRQEGRRATVPRRRLDWSGTHRRAHRSIVEVSATSGLPGFYPGVPRVPVSTALVKLGRETARDRGTRGAPPGGGRRGADEFHDRAPSTS